MRHRIAVVFSMGAVVIASCGSTRTATSTTTTRPTSTTSPTTATPATTAAPATTAPPRASVPPTSASTATTGLPVFGPSDAYRPTIDPARFSPNIDNPWLPFTVGTTFTYEGTRDDKPARVTVHVTSETTIIAGVTCRVVTDQLIQDGKLAEDTRDYYTQDDAGNVWYFGEDTQSLDRAGKVTSTEGTWHAGIDGAQPGVVMPADPHVGDHYRQEFYKGQAEDEFKIVSLDDPVTVPAATYPAAIRTEETSVLEPDVVDNKYYARGIGVVKEIAVKGPNEKLELVDLTTT